MGDLHSTATISDNREKSSIGDLLSTIFGENANASHGQPNLTVDDLKSWLTKEWTYIDLATIDEAVSVPAFISPDFLAVARTDAKRIASATLNMNIDQPDGVSWRSKSIIAAAKRGHVVALSPFSGRSEKVFHSIGPGWLLIRGDANRYCLASNMGGTMIDVQMETVWIFPNEKLILRAGCAFRKPHVFNEVAIFLLRVLKARKEVIGYLCRDLPEQGDGVAISDFFCPHMAHNLWNVQTAWHNIFTAVPPSAFKYLINFNGQNFFGSLDELYPELMAGASAPLMVGNDDEAMLFALRAGGVVLSVKDEMFTPGFSDRAFAHARTICSPGLLDEIADLKSNCDPLVVTTIRLDNREWLEQRDGYVRLFTELKKDFPKIGLIIDGLSIDTATGWTTGWMSLEDELSVARHIKSNLPEDMPVALAVGRRFADALLLCDAADCFIAPSGSGMALYKWLSNMPGLAFSNKAVLDVQQGRSWSLRVWHNKTFRHDIAPTIHISPNLVEDVASERQDFERNNFHLSWEALLRESRLFLQAFKTPPTDYTK